MCEVAEMSLGGQQRKIVVGIDFGTTFSGIAWAETRRPDQQTIINIWPAGVDTQEGKWMDKVPTELRYTPHGIEWGYEISPLVERHQWFKLGLHDKEFAKPTQKRSSETLTTDYLTALHRHFMSVLERKLGPSILRTVSIEYCLTVPAIWSEVAKERTLEACKRAGIVSKSPILLVSEPEAAVTHALHSLDPHGLKIGDSFVLCDAGGGTVDLISYEITQIEPMLKIKEIVPGTGGLCGSTFLNRRFMEFLAKKLNGEIGWDDEMLAEAMEKFDLVIKKQYSPTASNQEGYTILVPGLANKRLGIKRGRLLVTSADLREVFEPVVAEIINLVQGQIKASEEKNKKIRTVLMVGGFGENAYLNERLREVLGPSIEVAQPPNAWTAVVRGAVMMGIGRAAGLSPVGVISRAARKHYGIEVHFPFNPAIHDESQKFYSPGFKEPRVWGYNWFIKRGDPVEEDKPKKLPFKINFPVSKGRPKSFKSAIECDEISSTAPFLRTGNARRLVVLDANFRSMSDKDMNATKRRLPDGKSYYQFKCHLQATYLSASTEYSLFCEGKWYDSVTAEYAGM